MAGDGGAGLRAGPPVAPRAALRLRELALGNGWQAQIDVRSGMWRERAVVSVLVRFARAERHAVAQYLDGKAATAYVWELDPGERGKPVLPRRIGFRQLVATLKASE